MRFKVYALRNLSKGCSGDSETPTLVTSQVAAGKHDRFGCYIPAHPTALSLVNPAFGHTLAHHMSGTSKPRILCLLPSPAEPDAGPLPATVLQEPRMSSMWPSP